MSVTLIVGDIHLGKGTSIGRPAIGSALNSRVVDQSRLLDWVLDKAIEIDAETIILTGDICEDPKPDYTLVNIFIHFLRKCEVNGMDVHIIAGNHDIKRTGSHYISILDLISSSEMPNVHIHKQINTVYKDGVCFTLLPFRDRRSLNCETNADAIASLAERLPYELADIPPSYDRVLVGHLALEGSLFVGDEIDDYANELMCPLNMFKGYDYVWMGHVHKPQIRCKNPYIAHVGSLDISDFGETDHVKVVVAYNTEDPNRFVEFPVPSRPLRKIAITVPSQHDTTEYIVEQIEITNKTHSLKDAIVKIEIKLAGAEAPNAHRETVEKLVYGFGAHYICNFSESRNVTVVPISKQSLVDNSVSPKAAIKLWSEETKFDSEDDKQKYINMATAIVERVYSK
ncbi:MAG TPA: metallophosphoesterase [Anaerovoracaceae bacterium]|nr:metallophosphoesterase [Anaerovoracaceae bacterium]